ncbi:MAG: hypothetical protein GAK30_01963 [Paracidovorax wautersii]|uniref:Uncharacterized protein n=1 Tax=Paracidovorax wautersii TaxID=1177982 RepID=A0A7V8FNT1_9BURK|nr:MAG: hypothetical protein GAK30_01963 [Paracidovorax wautersii]
MLVTLAALAPWLALQNPFDPAGLELLDAFTRPGDTGLSGAVYPLGSDDQGRDVYSAILYGLRMSLLVGVASVERWRRKFGQADKWNGRGLSWLILPLIYGHLSKRHWPARTALG